MRCTLNKGPAAQGRGRAQAVVCLAVRTLFSLVLLATFSAAAQDLAAQKEKARAVAEKNQVEVRLDQSYADNDNPKQRLDLYLPKKRNTDKPLPVVVFIHGGGWARGDRIASVASTVSTARTGNYAAVSIGYRLTDEAKWPAQIYDCKAAIRWIRGHAKEFNLDGDHIAVWGSSAGGHLASLLGTSGGIKELEGGLGSFTQQSSRVTCVVNFCGPQDLTKPLMFDKEGKPVINDTAIVPLLGGTFEEKHAEAVAASPLTYVSADDPPFFNSQGTADQRVAYTNAEAIHAALQKVGVPSLLVPLTGGGHSSVNNVEMKHRAEQFLAMYLRGIPAKIDTSPIKAENATERKGTPPEQ